MSREAMQQALRSLLDLTGDRQYEYQIREALRAITALQAALAEPEQEPVALSDERIDFIADTVVKGMPEGISGFCKSWGWRQFARAILQDCAGHYAPTPQPEQEPVAWMWKDGTVTADPDRADGTWTPLYTAPTPQHDTDCHLQGVCQRSGYSIANTPRKPVELTDPEVDDLTMAIRNAYPLIVTPLYVWCRHFSRAVIDAYEAKLKEKNT